MKMALNDLEGSFSKSVSLPHGYRASFRYSPGEGFAVEWEPDVPDIRSRRRKTKFVEAYTAARDEFLEEVATGIGGSVLVVDSSDGVMTIIEPAQRH